MRYAITSMLLVLLVGCSSGHGDADRRAQIVANINAIPLDKMPPASEWPKPCEGVHERVMPGAEKSCSMSERSRDEFRATAAEQLRAGLRAFVSECGKHRGALADRIAADRGYPARLVSLGTTLLTPADRPKELALLRGEVQQAVRRGLATCFATETLGTGELSWIGKQTFETLTTIDDVDLLHVGALDPKTVTSALEKELSTPGS